jgi:tetratricopeptide (TPR) repeat protein
MRILTRAMLCILALAGQPARAEWRQAKTRHFLFYSQGNVEALRSFAVKVERFDSMLRTRFGAPDEDEPQRLTIFMLPTSESVAKIAQRGKYVAGFYEPHATGSLAVVNRERGGEKWQMDADTVLFHEYAHHFMLRYFPVPYPVWYVEGFAEYISTVDFTREGNAQVGLPPYFRAYGLLEMAPIPVIKILSSGVDDFPEAQRDSFYGRSWLLTHYLSQAGVRPGQLGMYLKLLGSGKSNVDAAKEAFGDLALLEKDVRSYLNKSSMTYSKIIKPTPGPDFVDITTLSAGDSALVMHRLALMRVPADEDLQPLIAALKTLTETFPMEANAFRFLGEAQLMAEQFDAADQSADAALKLSPNLSRALMIKADVAIHRYENAGTATEPLAKAMKSWVVKANKADTNDPVPLLAYYRIYGLQGLKPTQTANDGLARAYQMVPEDIGVRFQYASSLASQGKFDDAIRLIETIAHSPHQNGGADYAQAFLERLKKAKSGDPDAFTSFTPSATE